MSRVSIVIPNYNGRAFLPETLASLQAQTMADWEAVVVDDHSTDDSALIIQEYARRDSRIRYLVRQGERRGANVCRNQGVRASTAPWIVFLDADDLLMPGALEDRLREAETAPGLDFLVFVSRLFAETPGDSLLTWNVFTRQDDLERFVAMDLVWHTSGPIWRRESFAKRGGFDEALLSFHDWDFHTRALIASLRYRKIPVADHLYRRPPWVTGQLSSKSLRDPAHLRSHRGAIRRIVALIQRDPVLHRRLAKRCLALYWWLAERNAQVGEREEARSVWREAGEIGICNRLHQSIGNRILARFDRRSGRYLLVFCESVFRPVYAGLGSSTFHPVASDVVHRVN